MSNRWDEIVRRSCDEEYNNMFGFQDGAQWADKNISDDNIRKFLKLYNDWYIAYEEGKTTDKGFDYIKQHWNDEEKNNG